MSLHLTMLGTFEVRRTSTAISDFRTQNARLLLAYLALECDRPHAREYLDVSATEITEDTEDVCIFLLSDLCGLCG